MLLQYKLVLSSEQKQKSKHKLRESVRIWSFSDLCPDLIIPAEYGKMKTMSQYSVRMWEYMDQKNSEYRHFSRSGIKRNDNKNARANGSFEAVLRRFS